MSVFFLTSLTNTPLQAIIRDLEQSVRMLSDQVKFLSMNVPAAGPSQIREPIGPPPPQMNQGTMGPLPRQANLPPMNQPPAGYGQSHGPYQQQPHPPPPPQQQPPPQQMSMHGQPWFNPSIAAPQASHPTAPPPLSQSAQSMVRSTPPTAQNEEWDETYLAVLGTQDTRQLRELLARSPPEVIMPSNAPSPLSQAVILTIIIHRVGSCWFEIYILRS